MHRKRRGAQTFTECEVVWWRKRVLHAATWGFPLPFTRAHKGANAHSLTPFLPLESKVACDPQSSQSALVMFPVQYFAAPALSTNRAFTSPAAFFRLSIITPARSPASTRNPGVPGVRSQPLLLSPACNYHLTFLLRPLSFSRQPPLLRLQLETQALPLE